MKYRKKPEDFIVEEIADHNILKKGQYKLYTLEKEGIETFTLIGIISRNNKIPRDKISIAGMKDTHAKTKQYVTVPKRYDIKNINNVSIKFLGYVDTPLSLGDLIGNRFIITIREIEENELKNIIENSRSIRYGIPNYFDNQRFGSVNNKRFIAKYLIRKDYENAVKQYLTYYSQYELQQVIADKKRILSSWPKFDIEIENQGLKNIVDEYRKTKKWILAYKKIPSPLRMLFISAYQGYIWNECVKLLIRKHVPDKNLTNVPYIINNLIFYDKELKGFPKTFQKISHKMVPEEHEKEIIEKVLEKEKIKLDEFNIRQSGNFFKSEKRETIIYIKDFEMAKPVKNGETYDVTLKFTLPKGSYATLVLKKIFGK